MSDPKFLSVEEAAKVRGGEPFYLNVRRDVIPRLVRRGILHGEEVGGALRVRDDETFRRVMGYGVEEFVINRQGWSFVAVRAPVDRVAEALAKRPGVLRHVPGVRPLAMDDEAGCRARQDTRDAFLVKTVGSDWALLVLTVHWFHNSDALLATLLAAELSAALDTRAVAAWDDDFSGSTVLVCDKGQKSAVLDDDGTDDPDGVGFYEFFYQQGIAAPGCFVSCEDARQGGAGTGAGGGEARFHAEDPSRVERLDYFELEVPEAFRSGVPHVFEKLGMMAEAAAGPSGDGDEMPEDEDAFRAQMVEGIWKRARAAMRVQK